MVLNLPSLLSQPMETQKGSFCIGYEDILMNTWYDSTLWKVVAQSDSVASTTAEFCAEYMSEYIGLVCDTYPCTGTYYQPQEWDMIVGDGCDKCTVYRPIATPIELPSFTLDGGESLCVVQKYDKLVQTGGPNYTAFGPTVYNISEFSDIMEWTFEQFENLAEIPLVVTETIISNLQLEEGGYCTAYDGIRMNNAKNKFNICNALGDTCTALEITTFEACVAAAQWLDANTLNPPRPEDGFALSFREASNGNMECFMSNDFGVKCSSGYVTTTLCLFTTPEYDFKDDCADNWGPYFVKYPNTSVLTMPFGKYIQEFAKFPVPFVPSGLKTPISAFLGVIDKKVLLETSLFGLFM